MAAPDPIIRPARTAGYRPTILTGSTLGMFLDGRPPFTWLSGERMRLDPQVQMGLRILRAPLSGATWKVEADSSQVEAWVQRQTEHVYRRMLPDLVRFFEYGVDGGELTFAAKRVGPGRTGKQRVHFRDYFNVHPRDLQPWTHPKDPRGDRLSCLEVRNVQGAGVLYLDRRHSFWFRGEAEYGEWWGRPRLAGAYQPWFDKGARHAANDMLRLFYRKAAFTGPRMFYPPGETDMGSPETGSRLVSNQDIAREIAEKFETGGILALPTVKDDKGNDLWRWEDPKSFSELAGLADYKKMLDRDILVGLGIPPELVDAATVGSGYSGRAIPAQVFFTSMDEVVAAMLDAIDRQVVRPLVLLNFGRQGYTIKPNSLAKLVADGPPQPGAGAGMPAAAGPGGGPVYQGPRGGHGHLNPRTGKPIYDRKPRVRLSLRADPAVSAAEARRLWDAADSPVLVPATTPERIRLSLAGAFDERKHPRGQPGNAGQFAPAHAHRKTLAGHTPAAKAIDAALENGGGNPRKVRKELGHRHAEMAEHMHPDEEAGYAAMMEQLGVKSLHAPGERKPFDPETMSSDHGVSTGAPVRVVRRGWTGLYGHPGTGHELIGNNFQRAAVVPG
jgi:hypothetical protein